MDELPDELSDEMVLSTPEGIIPREMIYSPVERTKGVMMYELGELLIKLKELNRRNFVLHYQQIKHAGKKPIAICLVAILC